MGTLVVILLLPVHTYYSSTTTDSESESSSILTTKPDISLLPNSGISARTTDLVLIDVGRAHQKKEAIVHQYKLLCISTNYNYERNNDKKWINPW
ncbi:hypothetical protein PF005_g27830 [Phytophthora fragariae]|uniref:RxLR effector protein n=1 Tax=Phytophthora fragariae TaxID=53985 RepID=A0A6A3EAJ2_9STRA|nr:hypothetical protein PF003_g37630 [Phytophthora fragariae]KAE8928080.1 hypothetical protein PF009_g21766 [Phytophthora fragariae]KAE8970432.1 hypothetical protein PF011_g26420 [Phytophthora fragariae]KAE9075093.1 hypothetical protein PF006_g28400 [Phytophthora fragariae]KAE9083886.1 hypothetical protein PF007_g21729 [Phytophthora fragariae]